VYPPSDPTPPVVMTQSAQVAPGPVLGHAVTDTYYTYMESLGQAVNPRTLAVFQAGGLSEGLYTMEVRGFEWDGASSVYVAMPTQSKAVYVYNGYQHLQPNGLGQNITVFAPEVFLTLTNVGDCGNTPVGTVIQGSYSVTDEFFGSVSIELVPVTVGGVPQPAPPIILSNWNVPTNEVIYDGTNTTGVSGTFTLDTTGMTPCGYNIRLSAWDRALVNNSCSGHYNEEDVGFCLTAAKS
jgi:hypothetical protein